ncbi:hypothetical protein TCAP_06268 [Tolypocladium capitatum]|uniref:Myb-like DNA-binding protein myb-1 n=1 Tax=Tolypocladium capitatum TaxID=45235 RepID=A0A2K3Q8E2_9HYPO|nr:hypothetical protein TCAP_06268 [Tolypocladium capitatum]
MPRRRMQGSVPDTSSDDRPGICQTPPGRCESSGIQLDMVTRLYSVVVRVPNRRGPWSNNEDGYLLQLVDIYGPVNWVLISERLGSRSAKQCRERYHQNLKPSLNHSPITPEEGIKIESLVQELGKSWARISRLLVGRSDNAVKNWWNGNQNRRKRLERRRAMAAGVGGAAAHPHHGPPRPRPEPPHPGLPHTHSPRLHRYPILPPPRALQLPNRDCTRSPGLVAELAPPQARGHATLPSFSVMFGTAPRRPM